MKNSKRKLVALDYDGVDTSDYPKFCDSYISSAYWADTAEMLTEIELEDVNDDIDSYEVDGSVYESLMGNI